MLDMGARAPDFALTDDGGKTVSLRDFTGKKVVLYFYPKDDTPGCTTEACAFRDVYGEIVAKGAVVLGISTDTADSHARFKSKYRLPFPLLADPEKKVVSAYGVWGEKNMAGRTYLGTLRATYIIDETGVIAKVFPKVKPEEHAREILDSL